MAELKPLTEAELAEWNHEAEVNAGLRVIAHGDRIIRLIAELRALRQAASGVERILASGERVTVNEYRPLRDLLPAKEPA